MTKFMLNILVLFCLLFSGQIFALEKLTVILDWFPNPNHAPLFVPQQEGFFKQQGLEVNLIDSNKKNDDKITMYRMMMENLILEYHETCKKVYDKK